MLKTFNFVWAEGMCAQSRLTLCNTMNCVARQTPLSVKFSRQEYWSGLPCPSPGIKPKFPMFLALPVDSLPLSYQGRFCRMLFPSGSDSKECTYNAGDLDSIPGLGRSPGNPLWYSCLLNPQRQRSFGGYSPRGCKELHTLKVCRSLLKDTLKSPAAAAAKSFQCV